MLYISQKTLCDLIFPYVSKRYGRIEEVPDYENDTYGLSQVLGVLERVQNDLYYPTILEKGAYLLIAINKGHFFGNGNKRLALVVSTVFLYFNDKDLKGEGKEYYTELLNRLFPKHIPFVDFPDFSATDYATYNLSINVAGSGELGIDHESLKSRVLQFFTEATVDLPS